MVKSEINFRGHAFSAKDEPLHLWFDILHSRIQKMNSPPAWLATLAQRWMDQTVIPIGGCVEPYLDEFVIDDGYIPVLLELSHEVLAELEMMFQKGMEFVSLPDFGITVEPPRWNDASSRTLYLIAIGRAFQDLLAGKISESIYDPRPADKFL